MASWLAERFNIFSSRLTGGVEVLDGGEDDPAPVEGLEEGAEGSPVPHRFVNDYDQQDEEGRGQSGSPRDGDGDDGYGYGSGNDDGAGTGSGEEDASASAEPPSLDPADQQQGSGQPRRRKRPHPAAVSDDAYLPSSSAAKHYRMLFSGAEDEDVDELPELDHYYRSKAGLGSLLTMHTTPQFREKWLTWKGFKKTFPYYVPILMWLPRYEWRSDFVYDLAAGAAVSAMIVPHSLAMAILAGLPPVYGLYSSWITALVYMMMGNSRQLSIGPDAVSAILLTHSFENFDGDVDIVAFAHLFSLIVGVFLFSLGLMRFGFLDILLSRPLLAGFINAVALIIFLEQVGLFLGIPNPDGKKDWAKLIYTLDNIDQTEWRTLLIGICTLGLLFLFRGIKWQAKYVKRRHPILATCIKFIPDTLIVVLLGILIGWWGEVDKKGVEILGEINSEFPTPIFPPRVLESLKDFQNSIQPSIIIAILGFIESIIVAKYYAGKHHYTVSPNRELVALGSANMVGSFFRIFPSFGSLVRSALADMAGARTQLYNFFVAMAVLFTILFLDSLFYYLPKVVLASIIIVAAVGLVEYEDLVFLWKIRDLGAIILLLATFFITVVLGVELGITISLAISVLWIIKKTSLPHLAILGKMPNTNKFKDISQFTQAKPIEGVLLLRIEESLYFANIGKIKDMFARIERFGSTDAGASEPTLPPLQAIIIDARNIQDMDASAIATLTDMVADYKRRNIYVAFVKLREPLLELFHKSGVMDLLGKNCVFNKVRDAIAALNDTRVFDEDDEEKGAGGDELGDSDYDDPAAWVGSHTDTMSVSEFGAVMDSIHPPPGHYDDAAGKGKEREQDAARGVHDMEPPPSSPRFGGAGAGAAPTTLDFRVEDQPVPGLRQEQEEQEGEPAGDDVDRRHHQTRPHVETFEPANDPFLRMPEDESDGEQEEEAEEGFFHHHRHHEEEEEEAAGAAGRPGNEEGTDDHLHGGDLDEVDL